MFIIKYTHGTYDFMAVITQGAAKVVYDNLSHIDCMN